MENVKNLWYQFLNGIPNVVAALIILVLAFLTASIAKNILNKLMKNTKIDQLFEKAKIAKERREKISEFLEKLIFFITFILWMPGFFERLGMNGVASPIIGMMNKILEYLPNEEETRECGTEGKGKGVEGEGRKRNITEILQKYYKNVIFVEKPNI